MYESRLIAHVYAWYPKGYGFCRTDDGQEFFIHRQEQCRPDIFGHRLGYRPRSHDEDPAVPRIGEDISLIPGPDVEGVLCPPGLNWTFVVLENEIRARLQRLLEAAQEQARMKQEVKRETLLEKLAQLRQRMPSLQAQIRKDVMAAAARRGQRRGLSADPPRPKGGQRGRNAQEAAFSGLNLARRDVLDGLSHQ